MCKTHCQKRKKMENLQGTELCNVTEIFNGDLYYFFDHNYHRGLKTFINNLWISLSWGSVTVRKQRPFSLLFIPSPQCREFSSTRAGKPFEFCVWLCVSVFMVLPLIIHSLYLCASVTREQWLVQRLNHPHSFVIICSEAFLGGNLQLEMQSRL